MSESPGTWVKLGNKERQCIPPLVREQAFKHDLTWDAAVKMTKCFRAEKPSCDAIMKLGMHMSNPVHLKSRAEAEVFTNPVELTPRSAVTEKFTSAIKLKDGRTVLVGDKAAPPPPPPVPVGDNAASPSPPPPPPPLGNFGDIKAPPGNFGNIKAPPGIGQQPPLPQDPAPQAFPHQS